MATGIVPNVTSSLELHGAAASSSPHSILYLPGRKAILYASNCILNIATPVRLDESDDSIVYNVRSTLRTKTLPRTDWIRSITSLALLRPASGRVAESTDPSIVVNAFSDGTITLWVKRNNHDGNDSWNEHVVTGRTSTGEVFATSEEKETSIADIDGVYHRRDDGLIHATIMIAASTGLQSYNYCVNVDSKDEEEEGMKTTTEIVATYPTSTIKFTTMDNQLLLAVGTALPRNNRIHFYTQPINNEIHKSSGNTESEKSSWKHQGSVMGHLDWVCCLDWSIINGATGSSGMLASGSQDARIRLWKFHSSTPCDENEIDAESDLDSDHDDDDEDDEEDDEDLIEEGEARMYIRYENGGGNNVQSAVTLEALLIGHEEHITSVAWRPDSEKPCLISSSMDRCILIWMEEEDEQTGSTNSTLAMSEGVGNVWVPVTRVGTAGGILGGSVGSSLLGFVNVLWSEDGKQIVGHGFGGAIYFWSSSFSSGNGTNASSVERWLATPGITGHFRGCSDISWEASEGMYLLSGGLDQTCRLWMQVPVLEESKERDNRNQQSSIWKEVGRPQVHGYDLNTLTCIGSGSGEMIHRFVSGADEKEARAFDAPKETVNLIQRLRGDAPTDDNEDRVERAFIPSLGLSNRANVTDAMEEGVEVGASKDGPSQNKDTNNDAIVESISTALPRERDLGVASLWPEIRKLYGHLTEMVCLASTAGKNGTVGTSGDQVLVASSCKARDAENAAIRVWNVEKNICLDVLKNGHKSTVVSLSFSSDGALLASAGKDRKLCIWKRNQTSDGSFFDLSAIVESAHKRIIWSTDFCEEDSSTLVTGSRDGFVKIWRVADNESGVKIKEMHRFQPKCKGLKKVESVTATAFAPMSVSIEVGNESISHGILAIGMECGLVEIWAIPLGEYSSADCAPRVIHSIPVQDCHIGVVKKLAWRPRQKDEKGLTLASCSTDHGVRFYQLNLSL